MANKKGWLLALFFAALLLFLIGSALMVWQSVDDLPELDVLKNYQPPQSTVVYDRNNKIVGRFFDERRTVISLKKLPKFVPLAFVAAEDGSFFEHHGLDVWGIMRAVISEAKYRTIGGRRVGGSTITQQTARAMLLSSKQTYMRKIKEIILARRIEKALSKDQILHLYLNQIYFGNGAYGIEEASLTYFQKPSSALELFEAAALAAIPQSPNRINPFGDTQRLKWRQSYVLEQMVKHNFIDDIAAAKAREALLFSASLGKSAMVIAPYFLQAVRQELVPKIGEEKLSAGGLKVYSTLDITMQVKAEEALASGLRVLDKRTGFRGVLYRPDSVKNKIIEEKLALFKERGFQSRGSRLIWDLRYLAKNAAKKDLGDLVQNTRLVSLSEGLIVGARVSQVSEHLARLDLGSKIVDLPLNSLSWAYTNSKLKISPKKVSDVVHVGDIILVKLNEVAGNMWASLEQIPLINGGLVALDVETGGVLAMVGGYDFNESSFNRVMQAKRQPGSGIKPLIYGLAIDRELVTAASIIADEPRAFFDPGTEDFWRPRNSTNKFLGDISVRKCLRSSVNICTISLLEKIGIDSFLDFIKIVGVSRPETPFPRNLTIALGSAEVFPIDLANAMRILPNQGQYSSYLMIDRVKHTSGQMEKVAPPLNNRQVLRPEAAFIISSILAEVISGNKRSQYLNQVRSEIAGKTGTTNNVRSAWFFGYSRKILAMVFIGYDDNRTIGSNEWGVTTAFPIWARFMNGLDENQEDLSFYRPPGLEWRYIDANKGTLTSDPALSVETSGFLEVFMPGTAPAVSQSEGSENNHIEVLDNAAFAP